MKTIINLLLSVQTLTMACFGSEEVPLPLASTDLKGWAEIAGGVRIQIESPEGTIQSVKITAFGRDIKIPDAELAKLKGVIYSDVSISHEGGYRALGGHTIYFILKFQGMFGGDPFKGDPSLEHKVTISVPEHAPVEVTSVYTNLENGKKAELPGADQPATAPESKPGDKDKPQTESKSAPR